MLELIPPRFFPYLRRRCFISCLMKPAWRCSGHGWWLSTSVLVKSPQSKFNRVWFWPVWRTRHKMNKKKVLLGLMAFSWDKWQVQLSWFDPQLKEMRLYLNILHCFNCDSSWDNTIQQHTGLPQFSELPCDFFLMSVIKVIFLDLTQ